MSAEPARNITRLHEHRPLSPQAQQALVSKVEELTEENTALRSSLTTSNRIKNKYRREIEDFLEQGTDAQIVSKCLDYWAKHATPYLTSPPRIDLTGARARHVRWVLRHWEPREFCLAVRGLTGPGWFRDHGKVDIEHMTRDRQGYSEARFEELLAKGTRLMGGQR